MLSRDLTWLRNQSTHWRATCQYNTAGIVYTDYLRASFEDFDIMETVPSDTGLCRKYELINIRGNNCTNCTAKTWYFKGKHPLHIDSSWQVLVGCDFNADVTGDGIYDEDNFGFYHTTNQKFRCTSSSQATTQFWIGARTA